MAIKKEETNSQIYKRLRRKEVARKEGYCGICPPHKGENQREFSKHKTKPKTKVKKWKGK